MKTVYLSQEQFEKDLEICLTILNYPSKTRKFYVCEYYSASLRKETIKVIINQ